MVEFGVLDLCRAQIVPVPFATRSSEKLVNDFGDFVRCSLDAHADLSLTCLAIHSISLGLAEIGLQPLFRQTLEGRVRANPSRLRIVERSDFTLLNRDDEREQMG